MTKLKISAADMVAAARERIEEIETPDLITMLEDPNVVIVDIRDIRERQRGGFIPGSVHAPRGMIEFWVDPDSPYHKEVFAQDKKYVFHCASGKKDSQRGKSKVAQSNSQRKRTENIYLLHREPSEMHAAIKTLLKLAESK
jgi:rhodanese-related sulfurtransferase